MYDDDESPYFYPGTEVLINIPGLRVQKQLDAYERLVTADPVFTDRLTYYLTELNVLHPFREGNGRVQREFFRCLALEAGYSINWANADADKILDAMIKSPFNSTRLRNVLTLLIEEMEQP